MQCGTRPGCHTESLRMNTLFFRRAALLSALALASGVSAAAPADDATTLAALDRAMQKAVVDRDPVAFASFLTDDYVLVVSTSRMVDKDKRLHDWKERLAALKGDLAQRKRDIRRARQELREEGTQG